MKHQNLILILLIVISSALQAQTKDDIIKNIQKHFKAINTDTTLKKISFAETPISDESTDGGTNTDGFYKNGSLVKIYEWSGISYGNRTREYYLLHDTLFFVYEKFESFVETPDGLDKSKVTTSFEGRFYFSKNKLIQQKITGKRKDQDAKTNFESELQEGAIFCRDMLDIVRKNKTKN